MTALCERVGTGVCLSCPGTGDRFHSAHDGASHWQWRLREHAHCWPTQPNAALVACACSQLGTGTCIAGFACILAYYALVLGNDGFVIGSASEIKVTHIV
jgi:hypothetical protein